MKKWDFFIAHASADTPHAEVLYAKLAARSRPFVDSQSLRLGDDWDIALRNAQKDSTITVILVSEDSDAAFYQRDEIATAISLSRAEPSAVRVVPVYLNGFPSIDETPPYGLRIKHGIALSDTVTMSDVADQLLELLAELREEDSSITTIAEPTDSVSRKYAVDLCLCVDTGGKIMGSSHERRVLREMQTFSSLLSANMALKNMLLESMRIRVVTFGAEVPLQQIGVDREIDFDSRPMPTEEFLALVDDLKESSGQLQIRSNALEGLRRALTSSWSTSPTGRSRHIIAVWSDTKPELDARGIDRARALWAEMDKRAKRLVLYAPECEFWEYISDNWDMTLWFPSEAGHGLEEWELEEILSTIASSV